MGADDAGSFGTSTPSSKIAEDKKVKIFDVLMLDRRRQKYRQFGSWLEELWNRLVTSQKIQGSTPLMTYTVEK